MKNKILKKKKAKAANSTPAKNGEKKVFIYWKMKGKNSALYSLINNFHI